MHWIVLPHLALYSSECHISSFNSYPHGIMLKKVIKISLAALSISLCSPSSSVENTNQPTAPKTAVNPNSSENLSSASQIISYLNLMQQHAQALGPLGSWKKGEIEIILNLEKIQTIEKQTKLRLIAKGISEILAEKWSSVGIVAEDNYWIWVRDAVIFPSGVYGTYDRMLWKSNLDGVCGVAILPVLTNKKVVVNLNYRHATRSWEIELPRGQRKMGETEEATAKRELREETGYLLEKTTCMGRIAPDSGVQASLVPVFFAEVSHSGETNKEFSEAISENPAFSKQELKEGFSKGYIEVMLHGQMVKASCRDPFLAYALFQAEVKGLL